MKRFIDNIANEVIKAKLISPLSDIFTPIAVSKISADLVTSMAGKSEKSRAQREQLVKQLNVLTKGFDTCNRFIGVRLLGKIGPSLFYSTGCLPLHLICVDHDEIYSSSSSNDDSDEGLDDLFKEDA